MRRDIDAVLGRLAVGARIAVAVGIEHQVLAHVGEEVGVFPIRAAVEDGDDDGGVAFGEVPGEVCVDGAEAGHVAVAGSAGEVPLQGKERIVDGAGGVQLAVEVGLGGDDTRQRGQRGGGVDGVEGEGGADGDEGGVSQAL